MRRALVLVLPSALAFAACSGGGSTAGAAGAPGPCVPNSAGVTDATSFPRTAEAFCQVSIQSGVVAPNDTTVVPYDLNTPLFSDYATKFRTVWLPPGTHVTYAATGRFKFPVGTVITKSFGWPTDYRQPNAPVHWLETRVLVNTREAGWLGAAYEWNADDTVATLAAGGDVKEFSFVGATGETEKPTYLIPSEAQCKKCHADDGVMTPIGPTAAQLNRVYGYAGGAENQLSYWSKAGILAGAPADMSNAPVLPVWDDPKTGTTERRARAYLEANCSYCHSATGEARTTGLFLDYAENDPAKYGVCKTPIAAGKAGGQDRFDVVPGQPDASILIHRVTATEPSVAMPELERSLEHKEGVALLTQWVMGLPGSCK